MPCTYPRKSIGRDAAIALADTGWWKTKTPREITEFCLFTEELACPFDVFHEAIEKALGRPVWTHEFIDFDGVIREFLGERPAPTMQQILDLIPAEKRVVVAR